MTAIVDDELAGLRRLLMERQDALSRVTCPAVREKLEWSVLGLARHIARYVAADVERTGGRMDGGLR